MKVLKFGGTSVATAENIIKVKEIAAKAAKESKIVVVVSAFGGITDLLLKTARLASDGLEEYRRSLDTIEERHLHVAKKLLNPESHKEVETYLKNQFKELYALLEGSFLIGELTPKLSDRILSYGELLSSYVINKYFVSQELDSIRKDSRKLIRTNQHFGNARVKFEYTNKKCKQYFDTVSYGIVVCPGFIAASETENTTTLGRGGSDYTAAIFAAAIDAEALEIWTDVSGMYTANPRWVKQARAIAHISYKEAMELSHFGAKVLYPPTIQPVLKAGISIVIKNTFNPGHKGTLISKNSDGSVYSVRGISHIDQMALLSLEGPGMVGITGISKRFFEVLAQAGISVSFITQASSEHSICIGISESNTALAKKVLDRVFEYEISLGNIKPAIIEEGMAIIALVGDNMKSHQGLSGKMFSTLGKNNVNIRAIAQGASERNISAVIKTEDVKKALNSLHERFFESQLTQLNLFVMGAGNVGADFLQQIEQQRKYLQEKLQLNIRVIGLSNSRTMVFEEEGLQLKNWRKLLKEGTKAGVQEFYDKVLQLNYRNSIFVDNTASEAIASVYHSYLSKSIAVVTCNKIACSGSLESYNRLKMLSGKYGAPFLFETNVGAGLPIIDTLKNLIASGDKVLRIQAVLSGSLNFIFNEFNDSNTFHEVVRQAQNEGYTEPDPRIDLSGVDVMRKILILARESGYPLEMKDIKNDSFLPEAGRNSKTVDDFYTSLEKHSDHFKKLIKAAEENDSRLKYVAYLEKGKAGVGLQQVRADHPFYNLEGKDNIVLFYTQRYPKQPLLVKGAGAGADVTASGIFADIIRIGNF